MDQMFTKYEVGNIYAEAIGHIEGCYFDISDDGANLYVYFNRPTEKELENFKSEKRFEIRLIELSDIMMFLVKFGDLNWMDSPYTPHLSKNLTKINFEPGKGLSLTVMLFDFSSGVLKQIRFISLSERFTATIKKEAENLLNKTFDHKKYLNSLNILFAKYSTNELVKMSSPGFKIN